ncbi:MAG: hypothetical protein L0Y71_03490 [Gemmataceae bacterium]|nr:hypothetical protein [Gemmataceae bacterium]
MKHLAWSIVLLLLAPTLGRACSIPVFRYALERWELSKYEIAVFYERVLPPDLDKALKVLEAGSSAANITVVRVDLQGEVAPEYAKQWALQTKAKTLPWLSARLPETAASLPDAWAGPFTEANLGRVLDSPMRQRLVKHLSQGATTVFLLVPGDDDDANAKAGALLDKELARLAKIARLPELRAEDQLRFGVPLKIDFVGLKLKRDDPAERAFIQGLLNSEPDLNKVRGPIVFPVFGRGRLLCSLFGQDLTRDQLANVVRFVCGECSCQVKELNPGVDLLIAADWPGILAKSGPPAIPATTKDPLASAANPSSSTPPDSAPPAPQTSEANGADTLIAAAPATESEPNVVVPPSVPVEEVAQVAQVADCEGCLISNLVSRSRLFPAIGGAGILVLVTGLWVFLQRK